MNRDDLTMSYPLDKEAQEIIEKCFTKEELQELDKGEKDKGIDIDAKKFKKIFACFLFSTVTIYRLYHTHSLGSVEPTIALSESLWSRIVTLIKMKRKKSKNQKISKIFLLLFVCLFVIFQYR